MNQKPEIQYLIIQGDSLSDRGTLKKRYLGNVIPMSLILYFAVKNHHGVFSNGQPWDGDLASALASQILIDKMEPNQLNAIKDRHNFKVRSAQDAADITDSVLDGSAAEQTIAHAYSLDNDRAVMIDHQEFIRTKTEGGLTAYQWDKQKAHNVSEWFTRRMMNTLTEKRAEISNEDQMWLNNKKRALYDQKMAVASSSESPQLTLSQQKKFAKSANDEAVEALAKKKANTLIVEWSGANDLITMNSIVNSSMEENKKNADLAVQARIDNLYQLYQQGYRNAFLIGLPDFSLTPRFQKQNNEARKKASETVNYFNQQLALKLEELRQRIAAEKQESMNIEFFDINSTFTHIYDHAEKYGFNRGLLTQPFVESDDYKKHKNDNSFQIPGQKHMFWDLIHPTAQMHALLYKEVYKQMKNHFNFTHPPQITESTQHLYEEFIRIYKRAVADDRRHRLGFFVNPRLFRVFKKHHDAINQGKDYDELLADIIEHGVKSGGSHQENFTRIRMDY